MHEEGYKQKRGEQARRLSFSADEQKENANRARQRTEEKKKTFRSLLLPIVETRFPLFLTPKI
jgi:hypothetical protein